MHEGAEPARCRSGVKYLFLFVRMFSYSGACGSLLPGETDLYTFFSVHFFALLTSKLNLYWLRLLSPSQNK